MQRVPPRWVFWDLGGTLLNEDPLRYHIYELLFDALRRAGRTTSFGDLLTWREQLINAGDTKAHYTIAGRELPREQVSAWMDAVRRYTAGEWQRRVRLVSGASDVLCQLSGRYRMGIIADQPEGAMEALAWLGVRGRFDVVALDSLVGWPKPAERLFRWALEQAGCAANEAVMIGNRLDSDIAPARRIGMWTILCALSSAEKGWEPETADARRYAEALVRTPNWPVAPDPSRPDEAPDATAGMMSLIPAVITTWG